VVGELAIRGVRAGSEACFALRVADTVAAWHPMPAKRTPFAAWARRRSTLLAIGALVLAAVSASAPAQTPKSSQASNASPHGTPSTSSRRSASGSSPALPIALGVVGGIGVLAVGLLVRGQLRRPATVWHDAAVAEAPAADEPSAGASSGSRSTRLFWADRMPAATAPAETDVTWRASDDSGPRDVVWEPLVSAVVDTEPAPVTVPAGAARARALAIASSADVPSATIEPPTPPADPSVASPAAGRSTPPAPTPPVGRPEPQAAARRPTPPPPGPAPGRPAEPAASSHGRWQLCALVASCLGRTGEFHVVLTDVDGGRRVVARSSRFAVPVSGVIAEGGEALEVHREMVARLIGAGWRQREQGGQWYEALFIRPHPTRDEPAVERSVILLRSAGVKARFEVLLLDEYGSPKSRRLSRSFPISSPGGLEPIHESQATHAALIQELQDEGWRVASRLDPWYITTLERRRVPWP
jgi:hypothetical protein